MSIFSTNDSNLRARSAQIDLFDALRRRREKKREAMRDGRPLQEICRAFSELLADSSDLKLVKEDDDEEERGDGEMERIRDVDVVSFANASSRVSVLFRHLGIAFKFAERDYVSKVERERERERDSEHIVIYATFDC